MRKQLNSNAVSALIEAQVRESIETTSPFEMVGAVGPLVDFTVQNLGKSSVQGARLLSGGLDNLDHMLSKGDFATIQADTISVIASSVARLTAEHAHGDTIFIDSMLRPYESNRRGFLKGPLQNMARERLSMSLTGLIWEFHNAGDDETSIELLKAARTSKAIRIRDKISNPVSWKVR